MIMLKEFCGRNFIKFYDVYDIEKKKWVKGEVIKFSYSLVIDQKIAYLEFEVSNAIAFEKEMQEDEINYYMVIYQDGKIKQVRELTFNEYKNALEDNVIPKMEVE